MVQPTSFPFHATGKQGRRDRSLAWVGVKRSATHAVQSSQKIRKTKVRPKKKKRKKEKKMHPSQYPNKIYMGGTPQIILIKTQNEKRKKRRGKKFFAPPIMLNQNNRETTQ